MRIVIECLSIDLVEARGITSIERDRHIVELGATPFFELHRLAGLQLENRAPLLGFRDCELISALLDFNPELLDLLANVLHAMAKMQVYAAHDYAHQHQRSEKPSAQPGNRDGHGR